MQNQNGNQGEEEHLLLARINIGDGEGVFHIANANNNTVAPCQMLEKYWLTSEEYQDYYNYLTQDRGTPTTILDVEGTNVILRKANPVSVRDEINNQRILGNIYTAYLHGHGNNMNIKDFVVSRIKFAKEQQANENLNNNQNNNVNQNIQQNIQPANNVFNANGNLNNNQNNNVNQNIQQNIQPANNLFNIMPFNGNQQINNNMFGQQPNSNMFGQQPNNINNMNNNINMNNNMFGLQPNNNMFGQQPNNINNMNNNINMNNNMFGLQPNNINDMNNNINMNNNNIGMNNNNIGMNNNGSNHGHLRLRSMQFGVNNGLQNFNGFNGLNGNNAFC